MSENFICDACGEQTDKEHYHTHTKWLSDTERRDVGFCDECNNKWFSFYKGVGLDIFINSIINDCELCSDCGECNMPQKIKELRGGAK